MDSLVMRIDTSVVPFEEQFETYPGYEGDEKYHPNPAVRIAWMNRQLDQISAEDCWDGDDSQCE